MRRLETIYEETRARIVGLVRDLGREGGGVASAPVPACPAWSVHDVLAHMTGTCVDIMSGNIPGADFDAWTAVQVEDRRRMPTDDLLAEWDEIGPKYAAVIDDFPGRYRYQAIGDVTVHEQDIRGALGMPGARDSAAMELSTDFLIAAFVDPNARALGLGPLDVHAGDRRWLVGTGGPPSGDPEAAVADALLTTEAAPPPDAPPCGRVATSAFQLFRALTGRRSAAQIRDFDWTVDPAPYLPLFGLSPFTLRPTDLAE